MSEPSQLSKPILIYDGDCSFCRRAIARWKWMTGDTIEYAPYQQLANPFVGIAHERFARSVHLIEPDGEVVTGAHAVFRAWSEGAQKRWPLWLYRHVPLVAPITEVAYRLVADHRQGVSKVTGWLSGRESGPPSYILTRWLFIRLVGMIYFIAFVSLGVQILGLVGSNGILPAADFLEAVHQNLGSDAYWQLPTLAWLDCSDGFLQLLCWGGAGVSLLVVLRVAPAVMLLMAWVFYLSLYKVGQTFLSFQWDLLLLETGLLAIFLAPWKLLPRLSAEPPPPRVVLWLIRWLLFRLIFCSGVVKLLDENPADPTWHQLTALTYHYETQCIPNAIAWYAHQLPLWFQKFSVVCMFIIEIGVPFLIFLTRRPRALAFFALLFLQLLIILTGNYNFFNLLTIALCVTLLDDACLRRWLPRKTAETGASRRDRPRIGLPQWLSNGVLAIVVLSVSGIWMVETFVGFGELPPAGQEVLRYSMRFGSINNYGLFRSMTTKRPEIIVEGSNDRRTWLAYEFKWKPGDLSRRPGFVAPHQPRLDWQMWFAALGDFHYARNRWFAAFEKRLLEGKPEVLALLDTNPFADGPPRWVRAVLYDYHFTDADTRREQGTWWTRVRLRPYGPVLSLDSFGAR